MQTGCDKKRLFWDKTALIWDEKQFVWDENLKNWDKTNNPNQRTESRVLMSCFSLTI